MALLLLMFSQVYFQSLHRRASQIRREIELRAMILLGMTVTPACLSTMPWEKPAREKSAQPRCGCLKLTFLFHAILNRHLVLLILPSLRLLRSHFGWAKIENTHTGGMDNKNYFKVSSSVSVQL